MKMRQVYQCTPWNCTQLVLLLALSIFACQDAVRGQPAPRKVAWEAHWLLSLSRCVHVFCLWLRIDGLLVAFAFGLFKRPYRHGSGINTWAPFACKFPVECHGIISILQGETNSVEMKAKQEGRTRIWLICHIRHIHTYFECIFWLAKNFQTAGGPTEAIQNTDANIQAGRGPHVMDTARKPVKSSPNTKRILVPHSLLPEIKGLNPDKPWAIATATIFGFWSCTCGARNMLQRVFRTCQNNSNSTLMTHPTKMCG